MDKLVIFVLVCYVVAVHTDDNLEDPPEGYYAFFESPFAVPPKVRPPPYVHVDSDCQNLSSKKATVSIHNICGDLNKGQIPRNPMGQNVNKEPYPFELIRNHTLKFLSKTLPILRADDTLPKIKQIDPDESDAILNKYNEGYMRSKRESRISHLQKESNHSDYRVSRKICEGGGVFCALYKAIQGEQIAPISPENREDLGAVRYDGPPTPCPAKVEYATPVFAKNYQGTWRYVVQIPYEGYFTQTVEVTRCLQARCHYLDGGCLSSPRWVSLLVAEIFYPAEEDASTTTAQAPSVQDFQTYQKYLQKRAGISSNIENDKVDISPKTHCDGHDDIGCFQIRLYYDWFLIPGSCKCWRPDYFAKYVRRKSNVDI